jgi:hypothetical protein
MGKRSRPSISLRLSLDLTRPDLCKGCSSPSWSGGFRQFVSDLHTSFSRTVACRRQVGNERQSLISMNVRFELNPIQPPAAI